MFSYSSEKISLIKRTQGRDSTVNQEYKKATTFMTLKLNGKFSTSPYGWKKINTYLMIIAIKMII